MNKVKEFFEISKRINVSVYAGSLVYYIIIILVPIINYVLFILNKLNLYQVGYTFDKISGISLVIFIINLFYVASKLVHNLKMIAFSIYDQYEINDFFLNRIKSIGIMVLMIFLIILFVIVELYLSYLFDVVINYFRFLKYFVLIFSRFFMTTFLLSILLKYIIPVKIRLKETFKVSFIVSAVTFLLVNVYILFYKIVGIFNFENLYGSLYYLFFFLIILYLICLIIIYAIIFLFLMYKCKITEYTNSEHERGV